MERNTKEDLQCTPAVKTMYRSLLGQINWLQSWTRFQCCCKFSRCVSMAASPTVGDVKALNKLARQLKSQPVKLQYWPLTGPLRILGFPGASYWNNDVALHSEAWQCSWQNRVRDRQRMEWRMEVWFTMKAKRLKGLCSPLPWRSCTPSCSALVHVSYSVDCGWTYPVKLQTLTWGLMRRTW